MTYEIKPLSVDHEVLNVRSGLFSQAVLNSVTHGPRSLPSKSKQRSLGLDNGDLQHAARLLVMTCLG